MTGTRAVWAAAALALCAGPAAAASAPQGESTLSWITAQKPQSKLWHAQGAWWAALPRDGGVFLWRYSDGRLEPQETPGPLAGTTARCECDVVLHNGVVFVLGFAAGVREVPVHALRFSEGAYRELPGYPVVLRYPGGARTMTCDVDSKGLLWVGYTLTRQQKVLVHTLSPEAPGAGFSAPTAIGGQVAGDDLVAVAGFKGHVGVMWCEQRQRRFVFRAHRDGDPIDRWGPLEVIEAGPGVANDHINLAADGQGNLWAVTKATTGPKAGPIPGQFTLRRRNTSGEWDRALRLLARGTVRTRPIVVLDAEKPVAYVLCSGKVQKPIPIYLRTVALPDGPVGAERKILAARHSLNNATGPKAMVGAASGLLVLAGPFQAGEGPACYRLLRLEDIR